MNRLSISGINNGTRTNFVITTNIQNFNIKCENGDMDLHIIVPCLEPAKYKVTAWEYNPDGDIDIIPQFEHSFDEELCTDKLHFQLKMDLIEHIDYGTEISRIKR